MLAQIEQEGLYDPYKTSFGKLINVNGIRVQLAKLEASVDDDRSYGVYFGIDGEDIEAFIITGKDSSEESIAPFELPIVVEKANKKKFIAIDLREYCSNTVKNKQLVSYDDLMSCVPRHDNATILFRMGSIMGQLMSGNFGKIPRDEFISIYSGLYTTLINGTVKLQPDDELGCKIILGFWAYMLSTKDDVSEVDLTMVSSYLISKLKVSSSPKTTAWVKDVVCKLSFEYNNFQVDELKTVRGCCKLLQSMFSSDISRFFNENIFSNQFRNAWFGPGKQLASVTAMECIPVFIGITEGALGITTFKTSRLTQMLNRNSKMFNTNDYVKKVERNFPFKEV